MNRDAVVVLTDDAQVLAALVRVGCAATAAAPLATTDAVGQMRRARMLSIGHAFLDEVDPPEPDPAQGVLL